MQIDITQTSQTDMTGKVSDFSVSQASTDGIQIGKKNVYDNPEFTKWYGYYKKIPELKKAIDAYATWVLGKGFTTDDGTTAIIESIRGRGEEDFMAVLWNMKVIAKINGDSYAEIVRNEKTGTLLNVKPLSPENMRTHFSPKGIITGYEDRRTGKKKDPDEILHFSNERTADEMGGTSVIPAVQWALDARNEAMKDWRRISHRSTIRIMYIDEDDTARHTKIKKDYAEAIDKGELIIIPGNPKDTGFQELNLPPVEAFLAWIRYLENFIYIAIGIPKVIMGSVESIPESGGKISYLTYEQIYSRETREMEADIWNQLAIRIKFNNPASIAEGVTDEAKKNQAQTGFQPSDTKVGAA